MLKMKVILASVGALVFSAVSTPSFAATVKVIDSDLQPQTVTIKRGEEVAWVDATMDRTACRLGFRPAGRDQDRRD